jgi:Tol biopolymer transport system component
LCLALLDHLRWYETNGTEGIGFYSISNQKFVKIWQGSGSMPRWFPDSQRIIFSYQGKIHILDAVSKKLSEIQDLPEKNVTGVGISRDGKLLYFTVKVSESNIWLLDSSENK